jgi:hypothetical protein
VRIAYLVSAYKLPTQLVRLVHRLHHGDAHVVVHVDRQTPRRVYAEMTSGTRELGGVEFVERHPCHWGGFGHVRATLKCLDRLYEDGIPFDYAILLTGQDYPIRSTEAIERFLADAGDRSYISYWSLPHAPWRGGGVDRIARWHLVWRRRLHLALPAHRRIPGRLTPWGGSPYWCFARDVADYVHDFVHGDSGFVSFFEHVWIPDELFFQTILVNSPFRDQLVNDNLRYIDWTRLPAPAILRADDFDDIVRSNALFARKFDATVDSSILDMLDRRADAMDDGA